MVMSKAEEEVGFKVQGGPMTVQVAVLPEHTMALTFSEKQPGSFMELLEGLKSAMAQLGEGIEEAKRASKSTANETYDQSLIYFENLDEAIAFCKGVGASVADEYGLKSHLYQLTSEGGYYIVVEREAMDDKHLCRIMTVSAEFMDGISTTASHLAYLQEHGKCLIEDNAVNALGVMAAQSGNLKNKHAKKKAKKKK